MADGEASYGLVMPFVVTKDHGGPYDGEAFVAGMYCGQIDQLLKSAKGTCAEFIFMLYPTLIEQVQLIAMQHGWRVEISDTGQRYSARDDSEGNWQQVTFRFGPPRVGEPEPFTIGGEV